MRRAIFLTLTISAFVSLSGCSKESPATSASPASDPIFKSELLSKIPDDVAAFAVWDSKGPGYQKLKKSPWASSFSMSGNTKKWLDELKTQQGQSAKEIEALVQTLEKLGILSADGSVQPDALIAQAVLFAGLPSIDKPDLGMYFSAPEGVNFKQKLGTLETSLKENGTEVKKETFENADGLSISVATGATEPGNVTLYVAASEKYMSIGIDRAVAARLFTTPPTNGFTALSSTPQFTAAMESVKSDEPTVTFGFASVSKLLPVLGPLAQAVPNAEQMPLDQIPVEALVWRQVATDASVATRFASLVTPRTDAQKTVFKALEEASLPANLGKVPSNSAFVASLDTKVVKKIQNVLPSFTSEEQKKAFDMISSIQGLTLVVRNNDAGSPFPDLIVYLESDKPAEMLTIVKSGLMDAISSAGMTGIPWQSKEIAGSATSYISTPLGAGVYVAQAAGSNTTVIASSEKCIKDAVAALGTTDNLAITAPTGARQLIATKPSFALYYINFAEVANLVDSVKGSLAMFTGGTNEVDQYVNTADLRKLGISSGVLGYKAGVLGGAGMMEMSSSPAR